MKAFLIRILIAVICFLLAVAVVPLLLGILGFPFGGDVQQLFRICAGGIALLYVIFGPAPPAPWGP